jgi:hypothetical protein
MWLSGSLYCLGPNRSTTWVYVAYARTLNLDLHIGAMSRVYSTFISEISIKTHKLEVAPKPWDRTTEIGQIPAGETGVS